MLTYATFSIRHLLATAVIAALITVPLLAYFGSSPVVEVIREQQELRVATRHSPTTYFVEDDQPGGFEYELAKAYADYLGVNLKIIAYNDLQEIYEALRLNNVHLAAASLSRTKERAERFEFGPDYLTTQTELVYRSGSGRPKPEALGALEGSLEVMAHSSHAEQLQRLAPDGVSWAEASSDLEVLDLLTRVNDGTLDYTLVDNAEFEANRSFFPRLQVAFALSDPQPIAWMFKQQRDTSLRHSLNLFFEEPSTQALIDELQTRYFSAGKRLNLVDNLTFRQHMESRLPALRSWFEEAAEEVGVDWELLAAIGYQESHWNPKAVSPTGVRGVMMLTRSTAKALGVKKRTDPQQSIQGGARYFTDLHRRIPKRIQEPDRTYMALAAYNVGRGHLEDARVLTQRAGRDPDRWTDVREFLPLLSQAKWYKTVKHGFARGHEPVVYVRNIRRYYHQLQLESRLEAVQSQTTTSAAAPAVRMPDVLPDTL